MHSALHGDGTKSELTGELGGRLGGGEDLD